MSLATNPDNVKALADQCREQRREIERLRAQVRPLRELAGMVKQLEIYDSDPVEGNGRCVWCGEDLPRHCGNCYLAKVYAKARECLKD